MIAAALNQQREICVVLTQRRRHEGSAGWAVMGLPLLVETNQAATVHTQQLVSGRQISILRRGNAVGERHQSER